MCAVRLLRVSVHERLGAAAEDVLLRVEKGEEAAETAALRALLTERLAAAAEEIVGLFEETVAEYEERAERSEREICRQRRLLDAVLKPEVRLHRADDILDQENPEPPHIKEEQEEIHTSQEADMKVSFTPVKSDDDEEQTQSSQLHQKQAEQMVTEGDGEDCAGPEPERDSGPEPAPGNHGFWKEIREPPSGSNPLNDEGEVSESGCDAGEKPIVCSELRKRFVKMETQKGHLIQTSFSCSVCEKFFAQKKHQRTPTGEEPLSCSACGKAFSRRGTLKVHKRSPRGTDAFGIALCANVNEGMDNEAGDQRRGAGHQRFALLKGAA
ncbi:zinc finger and SCAN domain-containing protein 2-like isoform X2 [Pungitius pungitius]|uniref:zinc finger and SCAN domain-containing protein 2-like isoform X2 n=1 Tax=Pungitius pungitius TaxID=134920 RepID=UPI002E1639F0